MQQFVYWNPVRTRMALQAASNPISEDNVTSCSVRNYHLRSQSTLFYRNPTPAARRKVQYSSSLPVLPSTGRVCNVPVAKRRSSVWRPSSLEENEYFRAKPPNPGILEEFVQVGILSLYRQLNFYFHVFCLSASHRRAHEDFILHSLF